MYPHGMRLRLGHFIRIRDGETPPGAAGAFAVRGVCSFPVPLGSICSVPSTFWKAKAAVGEW